MGRRCRKSAAGGSSASSSNSRASSRTYRPATRQPVPMVNIPAGPQADIAAAWSGALAYEPARITAPTLIVRGEWDGVCDDRDAAWLLHRLGSRDKRDVKLPRGTHLMHLEHGR